MNTLRFVYRAMTFLLSTGALLLGASGPAAGQLAQTPWPMFQHDVRHTDGARFSARSSFPERRRPPT